MVSLRSKATRSKTITAVRSIAFLFLFATLFATSACKQEEVAPNKAVATVEAKKIAKEAYIINYPLVMMSRTIYLQASDTIFYE